MGNSVHVDIELKPSELNQCLSSSNFTEKEIKALWYYTIIATTIGCIVYDVWCNFSRMYIP
jgi:hypothetical protein